MNGIQRLAVQAVMMLGGGVKLLRQRGELNVSLFNCLLQALQVRLVELVFVL